MTAANNFLFIQFIVFVLSTHTISVNILCVCISDFDLLDKFEILGPALDQKQKKIEFYG